MKKLKLILFVPFILGGCMPGLTIGSVALTAADYAHTGATFYVKFKEVQAQNIEASKLKQSVEYAGLYCQYPDQREAFQELADKYLDSETRRLTSGAIDRLCRDDN